MLHYITLRKTTKPIQNITKASEIVRTRIKISLKSRTQEKMREQMKFDFF